MENTDIAISLNMKSSAHLGLVHEASMVSECAKGYYVANECAHAVSDDIEMLCSHRSPSPPGWNCGMAILITFGTYFYLYTGPQPEIAATVADALSEDFVNADDAMTKTPPNPALPELRLPRSSDSVFDVGVKYTTQQIIGKGAFGYVIAAECNATGQKVAIKKIKNATSDRIAAMRLLREMRFLRQLRGHQNVISLCDVIISEASQVLLIFIVCVPFRTGHSFQRLVVRWMCTW